MNRSLVALTLLCVAPLAACEKNAVQDITGPLAASRIKFFNFGVSAPGVNFYANATKLTAITSGTGTESTGGVAYGGTGNGGLYSAIASGQYTLTGRIADTTGGFKDRPIDTLRAAIADGKSYSFYLSGFYDATSKIVDAFVVEDPFTVPTDFSTAYVRFVHAIGNANPLTLYVRLTGDTVTAHWAAVGAAVSYKGAGAFTPLPPGVYDLGTRYTDSTTNAISRTAVSFSGGRVYTVGARGDITITSTTAANRPILDPTVNR